jgi:hypothetical protein
MYNVAITVISTLISVAVGAFVTWRVARVYYERASRDLGKEAENLRHLNVLMLRAMENAGLANFARDEAGNPIGLQFERTLQDSVALADDQFEAVAKRGRP